MVFTSFACRDPSPGTMEIEAPPDLLPSVTGIAQCHSGQMSQPSLSEAIYCPSCPQGPAGAGFASSIPEDEALGPAGAAASAHRPQTEAGGERKRNTAPGKLIKSRRSAGSGHSPASQQPLEAFRASTT